MPVMVPGPLLQINYFIISAGTGKADSGSVHLWFWALPGIHVLGNLPYLFYFSIKFRGFFHINHTDVIVTQYYYNILPH
jgi:hypothetical protein